jgi:enolase-phosphatase E1
MIRFILLDIEGTTTDIHFVHQVLFPYSADRLKDYVIQHADSEEVQAVIHAVKETVRLENNNSIQDQEAIDTLLNWIREDRKHTALKQLQGLIWKDGFEKGDYQGHVYPEVPELLKHWTKQGLGLGIYSSGSVQAQKLLFKYSIYGDLTPYFSHYFDTQVGGKKEKNAYLTIAKQLNIPSSDILFLSDVEAELQAATDAGFQTTLLVREGEKVQSQFPTVSNFTEIVLPTLV